MNTTEQRPDLAEIFDDLGERVDELRTSHVHIGNLIRVVETLIEDEDDKEEMRSILAAAHRYTEDLFDIAEALEVGIGTAKSQAVTKKTEEK